MSGGRVALVYPPTCDPTAPYLAVPMLTGFLRAHDVDVLPIDSNLEAFDELLSEPRLRLEGNRLELRLAALDHRLLPASLACQIQNTIRKKRTRRYCSPPDS
jgi:hypothetical protein